MEGIDNGKAIIPVLRQLLSQNYSYSRSKTISFYGRKRNWRTFMTSKMGKRRVSEIGRAMMAIRGLRCKRKHRFERNICRRPEKFDPIFSLGACQELFILQSSDEATRQILNYKIGITDRGVFLLFSWTLIVLDPAQVTACLGQSTLASRGLTSIFRKPTLY